MMRVVAPLHGGSFGVESLMYRIPAAARHYLIFHKNVLVSEDLRDTLEATGARSVDVMLTPTVVTGKRYDLGFLDITPDDLESNGKLRAITQCCRRIVIISTRLVEPTDWRDGIILLPQPFRSDDIVKVLQQAGMIMIEPDPV